ncbi:unnamed protein product, partial [Nippostrongylus brasiliensis]|uniref:SCP domain-containing protein n=1 Tax=Nippostrongylus brasiliensis TaxID=27835 RepID=A0A0N4YC74_NIPBR
RHVTALGVSYPAVRQCEAEISGALDNTINCIKRASAGTCARGPPRMIPKTYLESFKLAFLTRIKGILSRSGIFDEMMAFFKTTKKYWNCKTKCVAKKAGNCKKRNGSTLFRCGTLDPPDREAVEMYLNCAVQNGLDTNGFRRLCHCAARAGVR